MESIEMKKHLCLAVSSLLHLVRSCLNRISLFCLKSDFQFQKLCKCQDLKPLDRPYYPPRSYKIVYTSPGWGKGVFSHKEKQEMDQDDKKRL